LVYRAWSNNLVSGLIIAFEKPVNVGDSIEVNNKSGIMKSIGSEAA
jgi:small-conductance mechanosensitive channel